MSGYSAFIFDLDGVVWLGSEPIPGVAESLNRLRHSGAALRFVTNNASKHHSHYCEKLKSFGIEAETEEVISSGYAAAKTLAKRYPGGSVHVMGTPELALEVEEVGLKLVSHDADVVLVGYDQELTWNKLDIAFQNVQRDGADYIACNQDRRYIDSTGFHPGTGATVAALSCALGKEPDLVIGKPNKAIIDVLLDTLSVPVEHCLFVGDKLETDIQAGIQAGMKTAFVLSGDGKESDIAKYSIEPDHILGSAAVLADEFCPQVV